MYTKKKIEKRLDYFKKKITGALNQHKVEKALTCISTCARFLYLTNYRYVDEDLENGLKCITNEIFDSDELCYDKSEGTVLFYDGFGLDNRGLARIYLTALCKNAHVIYVTKESCKNSIPHIFDIVSSSGEVVFFKEETYSKKIKELIDLVLAYKPAKMFMYTLPDDVVAPIVFDHFKDSAVRYQIDLTDHAFWLGINCFDYCIEFRNYGVSISHNYRHIDLDKILLLPFYPILNHNEFQGFPFEPCGKKIIFSGGALYKTFGDGNKYYKVVRNLLTRYQNIIFWYAGSGNASQMKRLMKEFPSRVYLSAERQDLFEVLSHCYFYLSTYPISGGLMFQYAAQAGKAPFTLKYDETSNDFLINQAELGIEFENEESFYDAIDFYMNNPSRLTELGEKLKESVIREETFEQELRHVLQGEKTSFAMQLYNINVEKLKMTYMQRVKYVDVCGIYRSRSFFKSIIKVFPIKVVFSCVYTQLKRILK